MIVSVPLRGKGRDQLKFTNHISSFWSKLVSVPLRGKGRDQRIVLVSDWLDRGNYRFRPLAGKR